MGLQDIINKSLHTAALFGTMNKMLSKMPDTTQKTSERVNTQETQKKPVETQSEPQNTTQREKINTRDLTQLKKTLQKRAESAALKTDEKITTKNEIKKARRNFMDYLKNLEISGGVKVGSLPENVQKDIAKVYDRNTRRRVIYREDKKSGK